ncbi:hypothetical protein [Nonomuraea sediminis]|uniref:hypothetical protein n=1 Tax=Nonomuraea sediminis TaxID=2835864 RepID=UPI001BDD5103|nr:hypothetical protein [Nonomuraea sediminis]
MSRTTALGSSARPTRTRSRSASAWAALSRSARHWRNSRIRAPGYAAVWRGWRQVCSPLVDERPLKTLAQRQHRTQTAKTIAQRRHRAGAAMVSQGRRQLGQRQRVPGGLLQQPRPHR